MGGMGLATGMALRELFGGEVPAWLLAALWSAILVCAVWAYIDWKRSR